MGISEETLHNQRQYGRKLAEKQRGEMAELAFMYKAATLGFAVAKPRGDSDRYDGIVRAGRVFWRVQVKSAWAREPSRSHYMIRTERRAGVPYTCDEIDFLVAYIFVLDAWYIFPVAFVEGRRRMLSLTPGAKRSRFERYREAWDLMKPVPIEAASGKTADPRVTQSKSPPCLAKGARHGWGTRHTD